ncbi:MAG: hypothetical protein Q4G69_08645 [Planctomycetia bacterium]|nr:hypothetical protein [Planctomycetia bacterium]
MKKYEIFLDIFCQMKVKSLSFRRIALFLSNLEDYWEGEEKKY